MALRALLVDDPLFLQHEARGSHPERPERLLAARRAVERCRAHVDWESLVARDAEPNELARVHTAAYLDALGQSAGHWAMLDADTFVCPASVAAARRAAGASVVLVDALLDGKAAWGLATVRPPGHHARPDAAMGFCLLNNVAVAAAHARARGLSRVLVLDWDVHHGNGTQEAFYADPAVLYVSLHQSPYYPGTGANDELGRSDGRGYTVNVPLSAGAGDAAYHAAFERLVCPVLEQYRPELTLISAGFDAHARDPLGGMTLSDAGYARLTRAILAALPSQQPIGLVLEGGYDLSGLESALSATIEALSGVEHNAPPLEELTPSHERDLERAEHALRPHWHLG
jgi:acetoin utilization deacetylase AcuC-like enzyme